MLILMTYVKQGTHQPSHTINPLFIDMMSVTQKSQAEDVNFELHSTKDAAYAYDNCIDNSPEKAVIYKRWKTLSIKEVSESITSDQFINCYIFAPACFKELIAVKIVQSAISIDEILGAYAFFWHMTTDKETIRWTSETLIRRIDTQINSIESAKQAYNEAVYRRYLEYNDQLVQHIASYIIDHAQSLIDLIDDHRIPIENQHCCEKFSNKCHMFSENETKKAKTITQLCCMQDFYCRLPFTLAYIHQRVREIGQSHYNTSKNSRRAADQFQQPTTNEYERLREKALLCEITPQETIVFLEVSPYKGIAEQIAEMMMHEYYR